MSVLGFFGQLLSRRDWVYVLSLLVPFTAYDLALKAFDIAASRSGENGLALTLTLMQSDVLFDLGYALLWIGLFAAVRRGPLRWASVFLFHASTILVAVISTFAHQYFQHTGTTLTYDIVALWLPRLDEIRSILVQVVPLSAWVLLAAVLFYAAFGPMAVTHGVERWRGWSRRSSAGRSEVSFLGSFGLFLLALGFGSLSLLADFDRKGVSKTFARDPFVNVLLTGVREATAKEDDPDSDAAVLAAAKAKEAKLAATLRTEKRNVVLVHLEGTRAQSVTPYDGGFQTTPFLDELAENSLLAERAYTTVPHTSKAITSVNCGIMPHLVSQITEAEPGGIPARCLADLLKDRGYHTVFFQSPTEDFENRRDLVGNFGYEEFYPLESMDTEGFEWSNYFGLEDDVMLGPSEEWLGQHGDEPFVATYLTGTGHHDYRCLDTRYGSEDFAEDDMLNRYLNCLRYQDFFLKNLVEQYEELGLYEQTIFVVYGDHGEGFGEHGRFQHNDTIYEEGLRVPLLVHAPGLLENGERVEGLWSLIDVLPTVLDLLGYEVKGGKYPGHSLLRPPSEGRTLFFGCFHDEQCLASIDDHEKYVHHRDNWPDEFFDLSEDPQEQTNLANKKVEEIERRRRELLVWRSRVNKIYHAQRALGGTAEET